jgi:glycosyltransferase involved in cell wall biosynthesis
MNMGEPRILYSVIIPTFRGSDKLRIVLDSLCRQSIDKSKMEVLVIDDGSGSSHSAEIRKIIAPYQGIYIRPLVLEENRGPATARNLGITNAQGDYIFFTDDDCELPALWVETHMKYYRKYPHISAVGGWYKPPVRQIRANSYQLFLALRYESLFPGMYRMGVLTNSGGFSSRNFFPATNTANFSVRKHVLTRVRFNERFIAPGAEDTNFGEQIRMMGFSLLYIPQFVLHDKQLTFTKFVRHCLNRGMGMFVYRLINRNVRENFGNLYHQFVRFIDLKSLTSVSVARRHRFLRFLAFIYIFLTSAYLFEHWYRYKWRKKMRGRIVELFPSP